ncbi:DUF4160 domain-containing protein [Photorhabdus khanii]|uniref:DUF4160 domain-containing protein n=1 Tax=Photorhabdus khanii subsp. guanajuatensis TaxID=2100166 RepID=A0A4V2X8K7_9GAMM|nr:hypothetical protein C5467_06865 [Photorhabdus khanii subsp. guanajuatensis]
MYYNDHNPPHFHAYYDEHKGVRLENVKYPRTILFFVQADI